MHPDKIGPNLQALLKKMANMDQNWKNYKMKISPSKLGCDRQVLTANVSSAYEELSQANAISKYILINQQKKILA